MRFQIIPRVISSCGRIASVSLFEREFKTNYKGNENQRVYAVGDIHGCLSETKELLLKIKTDNDYRDDRKTYIIFLGDLVDRGADSKGVIEYLKNFPFNFAEPLFIKGNHEEMLVRSLSGEPHLLQDWLNYGGFACAESYGIDRSRLLGLSPDAQQAILLSAIPDSHITFLDSFLESVQFGDFLFVHAGIRPGIPISHQDASEMRWIRKPFLDCNDDHGFIVVHGHTISEDIEIHSNRIGIDTGVYKTGRLSAICVEDDHVHYFSTGN